MPEHYPDGAEVPADPFKNRYSEEDFLTLAVAVALRATTDLTQTMSTEDVMAAAMAEPPQQPIRINPNNIYILPN